MQRVLYVPAVALALGAGYGAGRRTTAASWARYAGAVLGVVLMCLPLMGYGELRRKRP